MQKEIGDMQKIMWSYVEDASEKPSDYVIATGKQFTVKQFVNLVLKELNVKFKWKGKGLMKMF